MRPYMLWLTRVYGRSITGYGTAFMAWPNVLDDWLRRCAEDRYRNERALRIELRTSSGEPVRVHRKYTTIRSRFLSADLPGEPDPPRAAGQGGR